MRFRLVLAGDGPARQSLENLVSRLDLRDVVHFAGHLTRDDLLRELLAADIGVFPSSHEMLPCAVLEMMATALPVVAYAAGGTPLIIRHGDTGLVAQIGSSEDFEQYLTALMNNAHLARQIGRQAACDARSRFDTSVIQRQIAQLYQNIVDKGSRRLSFDDALHQ
jgi:glycosyltransferase involved in cell wall biosynthesis